MRDPFDYSVQRLPTPRFIGSVKTEWIPGDGRDMLVLEDLGFIDSAGFYWIAIKGTVVDGASIPRLLWNLVGSPFIGKYRRATILHDAYCKEKTKDSKRVHKMFYEAMRCDEVPLVKAKLMYWAVKYFGPKFSANQESNI